MMIELSRARCVACLKSEAEATLPTLNTITSRGLSNTFHMLVCECSDNVCMTSKHGKNRDVSYDPQALLQFAYLCQ